MIKKIIQPIMFLMALILAITGIRGAIYGLIHSSNDSMAALALLVSASLFTILIYTK